MTRANNEKTTRTWPQWVRGFTKEDANLINATKARNEITVNNTADRTPGDDIESQGPRSRSYLSSSTGSSDLLGAPTPAPAAANNPLNAPLLTPENNQDAVQNASQRNQSRRMCGNRKYILLAAATLVAGAGAAAGYLIYSQMVSNQKNTDGKQPPSPMPTLLPTASPTAVDPQGTINPSPVPTGLPTEDQDWTTRMPSSAPSQAPAPMPTVLPGHPSPQPVTAPTANPVAAPAAPPVAPPTPAATCFTPGDTNANLNTKIGNMASTTLTALLGTDNSGPNPITVSIINQVNSNPTQVSFDSGSYELTLVIPADTDLNTLSIFTQSGNSVDTGNTEIQITEQGCDAITMPIVTNSVSAAFCPTKNEGFASAVLLKASESQSLRHGMFKEDCVTKTSEQGNNGPVFKV